MRVAGLYWIHKRLQTIPRVSSLGMGAKKRHFAEPGQRLLLGLGLQAVPGPVHAPIPVPVPVAEAVVPQSQLGQARAEAVKDSRKASSSAPSPLSGLQALSRRYFRPTPDSSSLPPQVPTLKPARYANFRPQWLQGIYKDWLR
jgi:hypothetical protein